MKKLSFFVLVFLISFPLWAQTGYPFMKSFSPEDYLAPGQVWDIDQSVDGVMWFAGNSGIYFYDGSRWRKYDFERANGFNVRALTLVGDTVFIGGLGEFGYVVFEKDKFKYHSLSDELDSAYKFSFTNIWSVASSGRFVLFQADTVIFVYDISNKLITPLVHGQRYLFLNSIDGKIYFSSPEAIYAFDVNKNKLERFDNDGIIKLNFLPYNDSVLMVIEKNRIKFFNIPSGRIFTDKRFDKINSLLKNSFIYSAAYIFKKDLYALGTVREGLYLISGDGEIYAHIDKKQGLASHTVLKLFVDRQDNLWAATNNGISVLNIGLPFAILDYRMGLDGTPYDVINFGDRLYIATHLNLYYYSQDKNRFVPIYLDNSQPVVQPFFLDTVRFSDGSLKLIAATARGLVLITPNGARKLSNSASYSFVHIQDTVYFASGYYLEKIVYHNGKFSAPEQIFSFPSFLYVLAQPQNFRLWFVGDKDNVLSYYDVLDRNYHTYITPVKVNGAMYLDSLYLFATDYGLYEFDPITDSLIPSHFILNDFLRGRYVSRIFKISDTQYVAYSYNNSFSKLYEFAVHKGRITNIDSSVANVVKLFHKVKIIGNYMWLLTFDKFVRYNLGTNRLSFYNFSPFVSRITVPGKGEIFAYPQHLTDEEVFSLPFKDKAIIVEYTLPDYMVSARPEFSYKLVLNGHRTSWSSWTHDTRVQLLSLKEGNYVFYLKARNGFGTQTPIIKFAFRIRPPFYRSFLAFVVYFLFLVFIISLFFKYRHVMLLRQKAELENLVDKRTQEIKYHQKELNLQEENLARISQLLKEKNAEINKLVGELHLARQGVMALNKYVSETVEYAKLIQKAMAYDQQILADYFSDYFVFSMPKDMVSGDFYWVYVRENKLFIAVGDCIGHGISGVLMDILAYDILHKLMCEGVNNVADLVNGFKKEFFRIFSDNGKSFMSVLKTDIGVISLDLESHTMEFAGIGNSMIVFKTTGEEVELRGVKLVNSTIESEMAQKQSITLAEGDRIYMFTDGFYSQIGGEKKQKYYKKNFYTLLRKIYTLPMQEQLNILKEELIRWRGDNEQTDDVLILGIKV